jgi:aryl-alcohol dehydrogenase-like predicted oxidoreductase
MPLRKRNLGRSGLEVSEIGMGAWQLGAYREWEGPDEAESAALVDEALRRGCTFFDTAPPYADGRSEEFLGQALEGRREQAVICTKFGYWPPGYRNDYAYDRIEESVEQSLRRLRTDYLDVLLIHGGDQFLNGCRSPQYKVMQRLVDSGVIRAFGVEMGARLTAEGLRDLIDTTGITCIEAKFNVLSQASGQWFAQAAEAGIGLIISAPLEMGWLSGKYASASTFPGESRSRLDPTEAERRKALVKEFGSLLPAGISMARAALSFVLEPREVSTVIPGAKSFRQLRENLAAAETTLPREAVAAIRRLGERPRA